MAAIILALLVLVLPLLVLSSVWRGYVLTILWAWFVVPVFHLPALGIVTAIGISLVVSFLTYQHRPENPADTRSAGEKYGESVTIALLWPAMTLLIGWAVHLFL